MPTVSLRRTSPTPWALTAGTATARSGADAGNPEALVEIRSGTRLRAEVLVTSEGAKQFQAWYDTKLGVACAFGYAADHSLRCLPVSLNPFTPRYSDPGCTQPLVLYSTSLPAVIPEFGAFAQSCKVPHVFREVEARVLLQRSYSGTPGRCVPQWTDDPLPLSPLGPALPADTFVAGEIVQGPATGRLAATYVKANDGAVGRRAWFDTESHMECDAATASDRQTRCLPFQGSVAPARAVYADAICSVAIAEGSATEYCAGDAPFVRETTTVGCESQVIVRERGAALELTVSYYTDAASACVAQPAQAAHFALGNVIAAANFAKLGRGYVGSGRLRPPADLSEGQPPNLRGSQWYDSERDEVCEFLLAADGQKRCLPVAPYSFVGYADPACTAKITALSIIPDGCQPVSRYMISADQTGRIPGFHIFPLGPAVTPDDVYVKDGTGTCQHIDMPAKPLFRLLDEIPPSAFVLANYVRL